jgi:hypothetical protein
MGFFLVSLKNLVLFFVFCKSAGTLAKIISYGTSYTIKAQVG